MIFYIASNTYHQIISRTIQESGKVLIGGECKDDMFLHKYVKENITNFSSIDIFIIDISNIKDLDEEIIQAIEMLRMMHYEMRIIIMAPNRYEGDELLVKCFQMSIYDLIDSDDFLEIKEQLMYSILTGNQYKDALRFKDTKALEKVIVKQEIKQTVYKVMIGIAGTERRIGCTHNAIVFANYLRKRGYLVALVELNDSAAFEDIRKSFDENTLDNSYFSISGVDYYFAADQNKLGSILGKSYNFILIDFGAYKKCDNITFNKSDVRIIVAGAKPWEVENVNRLFELTDTPDTLKGYHYCFNFVMENSRKDIQEGMKGLDFVHFLTHQEDPFNSYQFTDAEDILKEYLPIKQEEKKKRGFFGQKRGQK